MEHFSEKEMELARAYLLGQYNDIQFNYLAHQMGMDKEKSEMLLEKISYSEPLACFAKVILIMMMLHFLVCFAQAVASVL